MATIDPEVFSQLTNALQVAVLLSAQCATAARAEAAESNQLHAAIVRAVAAARELRTNGEQS